VTLFRLDASINPESSASRAIGDVVENEWIAAHRGQNVVRRNVGADPFQSTTWTKALRAAWTPEGKRSRAQHLTLELVSDLAAELREASAALLTVPLYNFGVPANVKSWVDLVMVGAKAADEVLLEDKPAVLVVVRGGAYGQVFDHSADYVRHILAEVWGARVTVVERELPVEGLNPAIDDFRELAAAARDDAFAAAREAGRALAS
jgi:FMN-dependent NADH-azoreductase